jgi:sulfide:quinone oxidoreductase
MKRLLILGAGTAGTMMANRLARALPAEWELTIVDQYPQHYYQPGFLFIPLGGYTERQVTKSKTAFLPRRSAYHQQQIETIDTAGKKVRLADGSVLAWDILVIATGAKIMPDQVEGLTACWHDTAFDFYTMEGAVALREKLRTWRGGRLVVHFTEMPIKCPVAPLEFVFLLDSWLRRKNLRGKTELVYVTPLPGAFTKATSSLVLGHLLADKGITLRTDFGTASVERDRLVPYEGGDEAFDLLVTVPTTMGDEVIERSGLGDELNFVPTDKHTLRATVSPDVFVIGDAANVPASKAGSVAHFQAGVLTRNILRHIAGRELLADFDGHANCFIESGNDKAFLIDFNYDVEPLSGTFPLPVVGPFALLRETWLNHLGKLAFRHIYWNVLLPGRPLPGITDRMSMLGKKRITA